MGTFATYERARLLRFYEQEWSGVSNLPLMRPR